MTIEKLKELNQEHKVITDYICRNYRSIEIYHVTEALLMLEKEISLGNQVEKFNRIKEYENKLRRLEEIWGE